MTDYKEKYLKNFDDFLIDRNNLLNCEHDEFEINNYSDIFDSKLSMKKESYTYYCLKNFSYDNDILENIFYGYSNEASISEVSIIYATNKEKNNKNALSFHISFNYPNDYNYHFNPYFYFTLDLDTMNQIGNMRKSTNNSLDTIKMNLEIENFCLKVLKKFVENASNLLPTKILEEMALLGINKVTPEFKELMILKYDTFCYFQEKPEEVINKIEMLKNKNINESNIIEEGLSEIKKIENQYKDKIKKSMNEINQLKLK